MWRIVNYSKINGFGYNEAAFIKLKLINFLD
jgi:hypothetical protein